MQHTFEMFTEWHAAYGYPVPFVGVLLENAGTKLYPEGIDSMTTR